MMNYKDVNIIKVPINEPVNGCIGIVKKKMSDRKIDDMDYFNTKIIFSNEYYTPIHLYVTVHDTPKLGDMVLDTKAHTTYQVDGFNGNIPLDKNGNGSLFTKKIIATTNKSLVVNDECRNIDYYPTQNTMSLLSQSFIDSFISENNKGNIITNASVEYDGGEYKLKINHYNSIVNTQTTKNRTWTDEELIEFGHAILLATGKEIKAEMKLINTPKCYIEFSGVDEWINNFISNKKA